MTYYETLLAANPATPLTGFALSFLQSPKYTANSAHAYAQTSAGEVRFVTTYTAILSTGHRKPPPLPITRP